MPDDRLEEDKTKFVRESKVDGIDVPRKVIDEIFDSVEAESTAYGDAMENHVKDFEASGAQD